MIIILWDARHSMSASDTSVTYRRTTIFRLENDGVGAYLLNVIDGPSRSGADYRSLPIQFRASMNQRTHEESACNSRTARRSVHDTSTHTARRIERPHVQTTGAGIEVWCAQDFSIGAGGAARASRTARPLSSRVRQVRAEQLAP